MDVGLFTKGLLTVLAALIGLLLLENSRRKEHKRGQRRRKQAEVRENMPLGKPTRPETEGAAFRPCCPRCRHRMTWSQENAFSLGPAPCPSCGVYLRFERTSFWLLMIGVGIFMWPVHFGKTLPEGFGVPVFLIGVTLFALGLCGRHLVEVDEKDVRKTSRHEPELDVRKMRTAPDVWEGNKAWFSDAGMGLMIHWGLYSIPAGAWNGKSIPWFGEWIMHQARIPIRDYEKLALRFNPVRFDAREWIRLAEKAGMRYFVFTAKHHDGFAMFDSQADAYNVVRATPFGRDPLRELVEACRGTDVKPCIYYSQAQDWHEPHGGNLPEDNLGMVNYGNTWDFPGGGMPEGYAEYQERKVFPQVRELLRNYGPIAVMWFDNPLGSWTPEWAARLRALVYSEQPDCLVNQRIGHGYGDITGFADFQFPEQAQDGLCEVSTSMMQDTFGYKEDADWHSVEVIQVMIEKAFSTRCNLLLNVGPNGDGAFPEEAVERLRHIAAMRRQK